MLTTDVTNKIVSAVVRFKKDDRKHVRVSYLEGEDKIFLAEEWDMIVTEGRKLWIQHADEITELRRDLNRLDD
tara:strand:+ start:65 stop:283 length:219 start_codon:yes stop_codon:yes gene_type:complete